MLVIDHIIIVVVFIVALMWGAVWLLRQVLPAQKRSRYRGRGRAWW